MPSKKESSAFQTSHWSLKTKLTLIFLLVGIIPALIITTISTLQSKSRVEYNISQSLEAINQIKKTQIENYFNQKRADIELLALIVPQLEEDNYDRFFTEYIQKYDYYDVFLINNNGLIYYTQARESDYQTNILKGKYASSNLGDLIKEVKQSKSF